MNVIFQPNPGKQTLFMTHPARTVGYGGAAGGGKSMALRFHPMYLLDFEDQRYRRGEIGKSSAAVVYFRRVMPNLRQAIQASQREFPLIDPEIRWKEQDHTWTFECGMTYMFGAMERPADYLKFFSFEFQGIYWDELTEFEEEQYDWLETRLRSPDTAHKPFMNIRWGTNPVGPGLSWVRRRFIDIAPAGQTIALRTKLRDGREIEHQQVFLQAFLHDNPPLAADGEYEANLRKKKPHIVKALLEGSWDYMEGSLLESFWNRDIHVVANHRVPPNTRRVRSCDFGINAYTSITWWYIDMDGAATAYHHLYVKDRTADRIAAMIRSVEMFHGDWDEENERSMLRLSPMDAACWNRPGTSGPSIAQEFARHGVPWVKSHKDRLNGIAELARRLTQTVTVGHDDQGNAIVKPMIRWMKRCEAPVRILPILPRDPNNPEDVPLHCEDHVLDDTIYFCLSNPLKPTLRSVPRDDDDDIEDELAARWRVKKRYGEVA